MKEMGLNDDTTVNFDDFKLLNEKFPAMFLPMFLLQDAIREKTLGVDWWFMKLTKYKQVRQKMQREVEREAELIDEELTKYQEEKARKERMKAREVEIKNATGVRKALLEAQQFLDETED